MIHVLLGPGLIIETAEVSFLHKEVLPALKRLVCWLMMLVILWSVLPACASALELRFSEDQTLLWQGETYRLRKRLTTILLLGIDQSRPAAGIYRNGGQADFQMLAVIDDNRKTVSLLLLDRDTMTEITTLGILGHVTGTRTAQLALAHAFGDGGEISCRLAVSAVENLFLGIPVDKYFAMTLDGVPALNDALGGVEVTLADDLSAYDPAMLPGATLKLNGHQAGIFLRQRLGVGDQTNASRLRRQSEYLASAQKVLIERLRKSAGFINVLFEAVDPFALTNMARGFQLTIANKLVKYELLPPSQLPGVHIQGSGGFMEFYPDKEALIACVVDTFCEPLP